VGKYEEKRYLEDLSIDKMTTAQWFLKKQDWSMWTGLIWPREGTSGWLF